MRIAEIEVFPRKWYVPRSFDNAMFVGWWTLLMQSGGLGVLVRTAARTLRRVVTRNPVAYAHRQIVYRPPG